MLYRGSYEEFHDFRFLSTDGFQYWKAFVSFILCVKFSVSFVRLVYFMRIS